MKKVLFILIVCILMVFVVGCSGRTSEVSLPEGQSVVLFEEDTYGYPIHRVIYDSNTKLTYSYSYYYRYDTFNGVRYPDGVKLVVTNEEGLVIQEVSQ